MEIGDKVKVVGNSSTYGTEYHAFKIGELASITTIDPNDEHLFGCVSGGPIVRRFQWVYDWDLVSVSPKVPTFDDKLEKELGESVYFGKPVKKPRKPDDIDWEAHRAYLKSLR